MLAPMSSLTLWSVLCLQHSLQTFDFQTQKFWIWVAVAYCLGLFVVFTLAAGVALRFIDPPHAQVIVCNNAATQTSASCRIAILSRSNAARFLVSKKPLTTAVVLPASFVMNVHLLHPLLWDLQGFVSTVHLLAKAVCLLIQLDV